MKLTTIPVLIYPNPTPLNEEPDPVEGTIEANLNNIDAVWQYPEGGVFFSINGIVWRSPLTKQQLLDVINKSSTFSLN